MQMVWVLNPKQFCGGFKGLPPIIFGFSGPRLYAGFATKKLIHVYSSIINNFTLLSNRKL